MLGCRVDCQLLAPRLTLLYKPRKYVSTTVGLNSFVVSGAVKETYSHGSVRTQIKTLRLRGTSSPTEMV